MNRVLHRWSGERGLILVEEDPRAPGEEPRFFWHDKETGIPVFAVVGESEATCWLLGLQHGYTLGRAAGLEEADDESAADADGEWARQHPFVGGEEKR